ncbi:MAG: GxxExxY protein [Weeksellaceae bacterium]|nr:GxxExxY protein [Bacteroidota bacterium]MCG2781844.1 GxxExxY protein [Weeksellaceae bacterium]
MTENEIAYEIVGACLDLHREVGPGLLESAYESALAYEIRQRELEVKRQCSMPFHYKTVKMEVGYKIDLLVEGKVIIELKSVEELHPVHYAQTLTYLKLSNLKLALLINFNEKLIKNGIHRIVNNL